jgi:uncharacterized protein involved in response to NO
MNPIPRLKADGGTAILSYGFRPFFFFGACYAALAILAWLPLYFGEISNPSSFSPRDWHAHEMLYGYLPAVITGFLLTAIPNWTGRLPLQGRPLLALILVWVAGRVTINASAFIGSGPSAIIDCAFLVLIMAAAGREIVAGRNWRNLKVLIPVAILALGNIGFHVEAHVFGIADYSIRIGIAAVLTLIMLIGGRIVPSFTRNWLVRENPGRLPVAFTSFDVVSIAVSVVSLAIWIAVPDGLVTAGALFVGGLLQLIRLARWAGDRTFGERLVLVLHVAYAFIPIGFMLAALGAIGVILPSAGLHAWMVGGVGLMTLAVMTRASLGHTGHELVAAPGTQAIYAAALIAVLARVTAAFFPAWAFELLHLATAAWVAAFGGFALLYGPLLFRPRRR